MDTATIHSPHHKTKANQDEEDEDDSLSLRDFPLSCDAQKKEWSSSSSKLQDKRRSSSEPSEFFEFFSDFSYEMSNAEDIIFCGKLMPYHNPTRFHHQILKSLSADDATRMKRRCFDSMTQPKARLRRSTVKADVADAKSKASKPWWFVMMFGPLRLQPEMDLRDMKSRQGRRNKAPAGRSDRRSFWGHDLLRVLSCKTHASVAVTTSIGFMPHF